MYSGMIFLLLHKAKLRMSVNDKDIIQMHFGYDLLTTQRTIPINVFLYNNKQWLLVVKLPLCNKQPIAFIFFLDDIWILPDHGLVQ